MNNYNSDIATCILDCLWILTTRMMMMTMMMVIIMANIMNIILFCLCHKYQVDTVTGLWAV